MEIFRAGLTAVDPGPAVHRFLDVAGNSLSIAGKIYNLDEFENIYVVGAGKAGAPMAKAVEDALGNRIGAGHVNVKYGHLAALDFVRLHEAGHPVPDAAGVEGGKQILELLVRAGARDLVVCLISGGGSALLPIPVAGVSLSEKQHVTKLLLGCGARIEEINSVRKHLSGIKGGQLAKLASPATLVTLILSDVVGDALDAIASGPTVPDTTTFADVQRILHDYALWNELPSSVREHIMDGLSSPELETPKAGEPFFERTQNVIIGSNIQAVQAAAAKAAALHYNPLILSSLIEGETREVAGVHAAIAKQVVNTGNPVPPPACIISGGETTVTLRGKGKGGRNQEFALAAGIALEGAAAIAILSAGTDGTDGPTDAAGAVCDGETVARARQKGLDPLAHLRQNDAYSFFAALNDLVITGPTNTNVMDLRIAMIGAHA